MQLKCTTLHTEPRPSEKLCRAQRNEFVGKQYGLFLYSQVMKIKILIIHKLNQDNLFCFQILEESDWKKVDFTKSMKYQFFHSYFLKYLWWKNFFHHFSHHRFQIVWGEKLKLHTFCKISLFPVILSWIIYENVVKTVKYISPTKSIRRENLRHIFSQNKTSC